MTTLMQTLDHADKLVPRAPWWIDEQPRKGEGFGPFWLRAGLTVEDIVISLDGITDERAYDNANDRLAHTHSLRFARPYDRKVQAWLGKHGL